MERNKTTVVDSREFPMGNKKKTLHLFLAHCSWFAVKRFCFSLKWKSIASFSFGLRNMQSVELITRLGLRCCSSPRSQLVFQCSEQSGKLLLNSHSQHLCHSQGRQQREWHSLYPWHAAALGTGNSPSPGEQQHHHMLGHEEPPAFSFHTEKSYWN